MRKLYFSLLALLFAMFSNAQNVTVNPGAGSYADLASAFTAINAGTHTGAITVSIVGNTTEPAAGAILNASGSGAASYTSITITPSGARTIAGAATAGLPLIDLNGADNVTINGLNSSGNSLIIENTTASATSGTSTIRFIGGATGNTITNCSLKGAVSSSVATNGATVFFSTDAVTANGNDNNTISNNDIGPSGANLPTKAILGNGSTSTTAIGNSGITITNNNIFDFFGAAVTSSAVATNGGCNTWTITNNKFYQTATRTWTTGAIHRAIDINNATATSGAQGFTITNNIVGYSSSTQTGTYTLTGSTGKFQGIVFNGISAGTVSNVNNNTVASVSLTGVTSNGTSTSSPMLGIMLQNGLANSNNNTVGSQSATGSLTFSTNTTTATDVYGIFNFSVDDWTANNNNVGGISVTNAAASGTFLVYGMRANTSTLKIWAAADNNIGGTVANAIQLNATGISSQVVGMQTPNAISTFTRNNIRNLTSNIGTGTTTAASVAGIIFTSATPTQTVSQNSIFNLSNTNTTAASIVTGIQFTGSTGANLVERNLIYDLSVASNSTAAEVNGIRIGGGTTTYRNNMIRLGNGIANAIGTGSTNGISGINEFLGTNNIYHNSVYISGTATAGAGSSFAFNGTQTVNTRAFRNNIFSNTRTNGGATGKHYAVRVGGSAPNPGGLTVNNNVYFANGTGGVMGFFNNLDVANLAAWQAAVGQDANSVEANPLYISATDLHIQAASPAINVAANVGVTKDFDNDTRPGGNALYDIGADERDGTPAVLNDIQATAFIDPSNGGFKASGAAFIPQASFTNNGDNAQSSVTVRYRILNPSAVEIYNQTATIASIASAASTTMSFPSTSIVPTGTYTIFVKAELSGDQATGNDEITGSFSIAAPLAGTYTVGSGGNYPSLTNPGGVFETINSLGASAPLTINIISDLTGETGTHALNEIAGGHTVLIRPTGAPRTITGSINGALIRINGADGVTIDGSTAGASAAACTVGGTASIRELTIQNTNVGTSSAVIATLSGANGAQNNTFKNLNVLGQDPTTTLIGIALGGNSVGTAGTDNDNNRVENCSIKKAIFGIYSAGQNLANQNANTVITQNDMDGTVTTDRIRRVGILIFNENNTQISYNNIKGIETNESADAIGIGVGTQGVDNSATTSGSVTNAQVKNNRIVGVASLSTTGFSAAGIAVSGATGGANEISNNMVSGVTAPATSPDLVAGLFVAGVTGADTRLYHNSVSLTGDRGAVATQTPSFGIAITGTDPTVDVRNNIFYTTQIASGGGANAKSYAIGTASTTFANMTSNYNNFWSTGANDGGFRTGSLSAAAGTDYAALANWQAATAKDANSTEALPPFVNDVSDLHVTANNNLGTPIASVTTDFDCQTRNATTPDMGADEFPNCAVVGGTASGSTSFCGSGTPTITASGYSTVGSESYQWYSSTVIGDYPNAGTAIGGQTNPATLTTGAVSTTTYYWLRVTCGVSIANSTMVTVTVNPVPTAFAVTGGGAHCGGGVAVGLAGSQTGVNYQLFNGVSPVGSAVAGTGSAISFGTQITSGTYTVVATGAGGCTANMMGSVTVTANTPVSITTQPTGLSVCDNSSVTFTVAATGTPSPTYQWQVDNGSGFANIGGETNPSYTFTATVAQNGYLYRCVVTNTCGSVNSNAATLTVSAAANATINYAGNPFCSNGGTANVTLTGTIGGTFSAAAGLSINAATGAVNLATSTPGTYIVTYSIAALGSCPAFSTTANISIAPTPTVNTLANQVICNNANTNAVSFSGSIPTATYNWTNNTPSIGLAASGTGNIASFVATNTGTAPVTATVTVTPSNQTGLTELGYVHSVIPFAPLATAGTTVALGDDIVSGLLPIGFNFSFYGNNYNDFYISSNGFITFSSGSNSGCCTGQTIPDANGPNNLIAAVWTDLYPPGGGSIAYNTIGSAPNRKLVVSYSDLPYFPNSASQVTAQIILNEGSNTIEIHTTKALAGGNNRTQGLENSNGTMATATPGRNSTAFVANNDAALFSPLSVICTGAPTTFTYTVNPTAVVNAVSNQTVCNGASTTAVNFSSPNTGGTVTYAWTNNTPSIGLAASGSGNIAAFTATNTGTAPVTATITVTPTFTNASVSCAGASRTFTITVNPTATVNAVSSQTVCNAASTTAVAFTSPTTGGTIVYNWTNNTPSIGLAASGTGNIAAFTATNAGTAPVTATITVTPTYTNNSVSCVGTPRTFTITVNPTATVNAVANQVVCNGASTTAVAFSSPTTGGTIVYNWTNNTTSIGLAASGTGNIAAFTATNTTSAPVVATITVTPTYTNGVSCVGTPRTFTITVNPTPNAVATPATQTICSGTPMTTIALTSAVAGTTYTWTRDNTTNVTGVPNSGSGNITGTPVNNTTVQQTVIYTITPTANGCVGTPITATVIINKAPTIVCPANITVNSTVGACTAPVTYSNTTTGSPAPTLSYTFSGATTGSGTGNGSGSTFNLGVTTVTVTATNACAAVSCSFTVTVNDSQLPTITTQPTNRTVCVGANATFTVTAVTAPNAGGPLAYQWQSWNGTAWVNIAGSTATTHTVNSVTMAMNTNTFRCVVTGLCTTVNSNAATLFVNPLPSITINAVNNSSLLPGQNANLVATASPTGGSYAWRFNNNTVSTTTAATFGPVTVDNIGAYSVMYTDPNGCVTTSNTINISGLASDNVWVYPNPNNGQFNVRFFNSTNEKATINVFNTLGQRVFSKAIGTTTAYSNTVVDLGPTMAAGMYVVKVIGANGRELAAKQIIVGR